MTTSGRVRLVLADLVEQTADRFIRRFFQLWLGLFLFGFSITLMIRSGLGLASWDVFHQGLSNHLGIPFGWVVVGISVLVLLLWIPLKQMPGLGTICNAIGIGTIIDGCLGFVPSVSGLAARIAFLLAGVLINGIGTALYIGAGLGPGPRDGLMTGLAKRGISIRVARTGIELTVLAIGWVLRGDVGIGTVLYAVSIGPLVHHLLPLLTVPQTRSKPATEAAMRGLLYRSDAGPRSTESPTTGEASSA